MMLTVVNLTLIDLPGLTKVAVGEFRIIIVLAILDYGVLWRPWFHPCMIFVEGQSESIVADIENMVRSYIEKVCNL